jgi:hypothetical protein
MVDLGILVEGETERDFVNQILKPHLGVFGIDAWATLPGRKNRRGGVRRWVSVRDDLIRMMKQRIGRHVSTMFDFYALPNDWPGRADAPDAEPAAKANHVEAALLTALAHSASDNFDARLFVPYIQMHEFESMMFVNTEISTRTIESAAAASPDIVEKLDNILRECGSPEAINDRGGQNPAARLMQVLKYFNKRVHGPRIVAETGLPAIRAACPHFNDWITRLESLGGRAS